MQVVLYGGEIALIDDADERLVGEYKWHAQSGSLPYARAYDIATRKAILMHRLILNHPFGLVVDHINGNVLDNRRANLRPCKRTQNLLNSRTRIDCSSGIRNIEWNTARKRWRATVRFEKAIHRKEFKTAAQASSWAEAKRLELHGEFAFVAEDLS